MPKTRRTKHNGKAPLKSRNIKLIELGTTPHAILNPEAKHERSRRNVSVTILSGVNRGKNYPYRSTKRGGRAIPDVRLAPRDVVARVD